MSQPFDGQAQRRGTMATGAIGSLARHLRRKGAFLQGWARRRTGHAHARPDQGSTVNRTPHMLALSRYFHYVYALLTLCVSVCVNPTSDVVLALRAGRHAAASLPRGRGCRRWDRDAAMPRTAGARLVCFVLYPPSHPGGDHAAPRMDMHLTCVSSRLGVCPCPWTW